MLKTLTCIDCRVEFTYDHRKGPTRQRCDACSIVHRKDSSRARSAKYRQDHPEKNREQQNRYNRKRLADPEHLRWKREDAMRRAYGLEPEDFAALVESQGGKCAVCKGDPNGPGTRLHVDHCHNSNRVRGLLCAKCNTAIGLLDDDPDRADALAAYLRI